MNPLLIIKVAAAVGSAAASYAAEKIIVNVGKKILRVH